MWSSVSDAHFSLLFARYSKYAAGGLLHCRFGHAPLLFVFDTSLENLLDKRPYSPFGNSRTECLRPACVFLGPKLLRKTLFLPTSLAL